MRLSSFAMGEWTIVKVASLLMAMAVSASAEPEYGTLQSGDPFTNFVGEKTAATIDFSNGIREPDGTVCVERRKSVDKTEKDQLKECFVQNVTQCYNTYITEYSDVEVQKCEDFYWKQCKIVFKERTFDATSRVCKKALIKDCGGGGSNQQYGSNSLSDDVVCNTFFETECNTTDIVPEPGYEPTPITYCDKIPRKICAPENCRVVEGPEVCTESVSDGFIEEPVELCDLQPQQHCRSTKASVPRLTPEKHCRQVEKELCVTQLVNPHITEQKLVVKYCKRDPKRAYGGGSSSSSSYVPAPPPPPAPSNIDYGQAALPSLPVYSSPQQQFYTPSSRSKRRDLSATTSNDENRSNSVFIPNPNLVVVPTKGNAEPELPDKLRDYLERQLWPSAASSDTTSVVTAQRREDSVLSSKQGVAEHPADYLNMVKSKEASSSLSKRLGKSNSNMDDQPWTPIFTKHSRTLE